MADKPSLGMKPILTLGGAYTLKISYDASDNIEYIGIAKPGSATSAAVWQIKKLTYSTDQITDLQWATGSDNFKHVWDNRASLSYS